MPTRPSLLIALLLALPVGWLGTSLWRDVAAAWALDRDGDLMTRETRVEGSRLEVRYGGRWRFVGRDPEAPGHSRGHYWTGRLEPGDPAPPPVAARSDERDFLAVLDWTTGLVPVTVRLLVLGFLLGVLIRLAWIRSPRAPEPGNSPPAATPG